MTDSRRTIPISTTPRAAVAAAAAAAALFAGCAAATAPQPGWQQQLAERGLRIGPDVMSVPNFSFSGFDALDDEHLVVHMGASRRALITAAPGCIGLDDAHVIAYRSLGPTLTRFDRLRVAGAGVPRMDCRIESIRMLERIETTAPK